MCILFYISFLSLFLYCYCYLYHLGVNEEFSRFEVSIDSISIEWLLNLYDFIKPVGLSRNICYVNLKNFKNWSFFFMGFFYRFFSEIYSRSTAISHNRIIIGFFWYVLIREYKSLSDNRNVIKREQFSISISKELNLYFVNCEEFLS